MKEYIEPIIDVLWLTEDIITTSGESGLPDLPDKTGPDVFNISQPIKESDMSRYIVSSDNTYTYKSLRKIKYKKFLKLYEKNGFIDFDFDIEKGIFGWNVELPYGLSVSPDETFGELVDRLKMIESNPMQWHCSWLHKKIIDIDDILPTLYVPALADNDVDSSYIITPSLSSIITWGNYCDYIKNLITSCNAIDMPMSLLQIDDKTYGLPIPLYTKSTVHDGADTYDTYEFFTNIQLTVREV